MDRSSEEIDFGAENPWIEAPELLQQPHTRRAMNRRHRKRDARDRPVVERDQSIGNGGVIKCGETARIAPAGLLLRGARVDVAGVKRPQSGTLEQCEYRFTPAAAEVAVARRDGARSTGIAAVTTPGQSEAGQRFGGGDLHRCRPHRNASTCAISAAISRSGGRLPDFRQSVNQRYNWGKLLRSSG